MKKLLILFFVFILGMLVATILFHYGIVVKGQEGCGEWVPCEPAWLTRGQGGVDSMRTDTVGWYVEFEERENGDILYLDITYVDSEYVISVEHYTYYKFLWADNLPSPVSVWVPKPCPPREMEPKGCGKWVELSLYGRVDDLGKFYCFIYPEGIPRPESVWIHPLYRKSVENVKCLTSGWVRIGTANCIYGNPLSAALYLSDDSTHPGSVWIEKPCPDDSINAILDSILVDLDFKATTHLIFQVWDKQPCNPGREDTLWCPITKLDSSVVREAICEEDYHMDNGHILGHFPCYCLILDGIRYWMKENPLSYLKKEKK